MLQADGEFHWYFASEMFKILLFESFKMALEKPYWEPEKIGEANIFSFYFKRIVSMAAFFKFGYPMVIFNIQFKFKRYEVI